MLYTGGEHEEATTRQEVTPSTAPSSTETSVEGGGILQTTAAQEPVKPFLDEGVPFAAQNAVAARPVLQPSLFDNIVDLTHRWRVPLSLLLGVALSGTIYVAYQARFDDSVSSQESLRLTPPATTDAAALADDGDDTDDTDSEAEEAANGPATVSTESDADSGSVLDSTTTSDRGSNTTVTSATSQPTESTTAPTTPPESTTSTTATTTTTVPTTAAPPPASVSGTVSFDSGDGQRVKSLEVRLVPDSDEPRSDAFTGIDGTYRFEADAACYRLRFVVPNDQRIVNGQQDTQLCVEAGQAVTIDLTITLPSVRAPRGCEIQIGDDNGAGVELYDPQERWADSYAFYGESGQFVLSTYGFGGPDDLDRGEASIEWTSNANGFEESDVYMVAAEHPQGVTSELVVCSRRER